MNEKDFMEIINRGELKEPYITYHSMVRCLNSTMKDVYKYNDDSYKEGITNCAIRLKMIMGYLSDYCDEYKIEPPEFLVKCSKILKSPLLSDIALDILSKEDPSRMDPLLIKMQLDNDIDFSIKTIILMQEFIQIINKIKSGELKRNDNEVIMKSREFLNRVNNIRKEIAISPYDHLSTNTLLSYVELFSFDVIKEFGGE